MMIVSPENERPSASTLEIAVLPRACEWVVELQDDEGGRRVPLTARLVVGSARDADLLVRDPTVSGRHCAINLFGGGVAVEDLGSKNGTFVGSARVMNAWAGVGTTVTIGHATLAFFEARSSHPDETGWEFKPLAGVTGGSALMRRVGEQARRLAKHSVPVLISGESGTGKELIARALHGEGPRAAGPFIAINVAALPRELVESEMFGHERGAFTGAVSKRTGAFIEAEGGTLFLDEIGELPLDAQPKLLRALDGYEVRRVGGAGGGRRANVRVVAATHVALEERVLAGQFRRDLFHRLEVFVIEVPPLRMRRGDIAPIARELLAQMAAEIGCRNVTSAALALLATYDWPGNVRELRNVLYRAADIATARMIDARDVDAAMRTRPEARALTFTPSLAKTWFEQHENNLSAAARAAGMPRSSFRKLLKD